MKKTIIYLVVFTVIWLLVSLVVTYVFSLFNVDPQQSKWAKYVMIAIAAFAASVTTPWTISQLAKLF